jgi:hypothetical protein
VSSLKKNIVDTSTPSVFSFIFDITMNPRHKFAIRGSALKRVEAFKYLGCLLGQDDDAGKTSWIPVIIAVATCSNCSLDVGMTMLMKSSTYTSRA